MTDLISIKHRLAYILATPLFTYLTLTFINLYIISIPLEHSTNLCQRIFSRKRDLEALMIDHKIDINIVDPTIVLYLT